MRGRKVASKNSVNQQNLKLKPKLKNNQHIIESGKQKAIETQESVNISQS
jgi:hypothetical protein